MTYECESDDPWTVLGIGHDATPDRIRRAYIEQVKRSPPDRNPSAFERVRDAYEILKDPHRRIERMILAADPAAPLVELLEKEPVERCFVGPGPWLDVIRGT